MASKADRTIPNLANATPGFLVDEIARMRIESARLKFLDGVYKQALEARMSEAEKEGMADVKGEKFQAHRKIVRQERIDSDAVKEHFAADPEGLKKVMKVIEFYQLETSPLETGEINVSDQT